MRRLEGKTAIVTGAGRGIGRGIAVAFGREGANVVVASRTKSTVDSAVSEIEAEGGTAIGVACDVGRRDDVFAMVAKAASAFGRIDILVNNAGYGVIGAIEETSAVEVERVYATNVFGLLNVTRAALPTMRAQGSGHVLNFSSIGGYASAAGFGIYCSTKFAVEGISEAMCVELEPLGIHTTVVEPGYFRTTFLSDGSVVSTAARIDDYAGTVGKVRDFAAGAHGQQPGDPQKLAEAMIALVNARKPPRRLPLGADTVKRIEQKHREVEAEFGEWRSLAMSTGFVQ